MHLLSTPNAGILITYNFKVLIGFGFLGSPYDLSKSQIANVSELGDLTFGIPRFKNNRNHVSFLWWKLTPFLFFLLTGPSTAIRPLHTGVFRYHHRIQVNVRIEFQHVQRFHVPYTHPTLTTPQPPPPPPTTIYKQQKVLQNSSPSHANSGNVNRFWIHYRLHVYRLSV